MTGELLDDHFSAIPPRGNTQIPDDGRNRSSAPVLNRVRASRLGRPIYEEKVTVKIEIPVRLNDLLEQFKVFKRIPKNEMITLALEELLQQS
jgi:hypothetical protein